MTKTITILPQYRALPGDRLHPGQRMVSLDTSALLRVGMDSGTIFFDPTGPGDRVEVGRVRGMNVTQRVRAARLFVLRNVPDAVVEAGYRIVAHEEVNDLG